MAFLGTLVGLVWLLSAAWVIYEMATKHKHWKIGRRILWIVCAVLFSVVTAVVYYFTEFKKK